MREATIRDVDGFSDPLVLQALAFRVRAACEAAESGAALEDRGALERATRFLRHAQTGVVLKEHGGHSATPSLDLLLAGYTRLAVLKIHEAAGATGGLPTYLDSLTTSFDRAAKSGDLRAEAPWTLKTFAQLWTQLFHLAAQAAADPTDVRTSERSYST
jgi:hypothetical protein